MAHTTTNPNGEAVRAVVAILDMRDASITDDVSERTSTTAADSAKPMRAQRARAVLLATADTFFSGILARPRHQRSKSARGSNDHGDARLATIRSPLAVLADDAIPSQPPPR
jgi:hypothetical protein